MPGKLTPKHWKALTLLEEGTLTYTEIAAACGFKRDDFQQLCDGDCRDGETAVLFKAELDKIAQRDWDKVKTLVKDNKKLAMFKLNEWLRTCQKKKPDHIMIGQINKTLLAMGKATPALEIGSFTYNEGMSPEDLVYEFKRLTSLARSALNTRGVPGSGQQGPEGLPGPASKRSKVQEKP